MIAFDPMAQTRKAGQPLSQSLHVYASEGATIWEVARAEGISYDAVRTRCYRAGVKLSEENAKTVRQIAEGMKPLEAVEYLLTVIEANEREAASEWEAIGVDLTALEQKIFAALHKNLGRTVTKDRIYDAAYACKISADELPSIKIIDVLIHRLRSKLSDHYSINTVWGVGYRMELFEA